VKQYKLLYYIGMSTSLLIGLWHFFVPTLYGWYTYIPKEYEVLSVTIDYVNICFSMLLFGLSALLIWWGKRIFKGNQEATTLYAFMAFVWVARTVVAFVKPIPDGANPWLSYGQLIASIVIAILLIVPLIKLHINRKRGKENE
jgi:hypothetical protein